MALTREKLVRIIERRVHNRDLAEAIMDDIDVAYMAADEGEGVPPPPVRESLREIPRSRPMAPQPPRDSVIPAPRDYAEGSKVLPTVPEDRKIILPGDKEFNQTTETSGGKISRPVPVGRVSSPGKAKRRTLTKWWDPETLIPELEKNFPPEMDIMPPGRTRPIRVERNIQQVVTQDGSAIVRVEYAHKFASRELGSAQAGEVTKLPAVAVQVYGFYDREIDIAGGMDNLLTQLNGMYKPKPGSIEPVMGQEVPLRPEMAASTDAVRMDITQGWRPVGNFEQVQLRDGTVMQVARAQGAVLGGLADQHRQEAPEVFKDAIGRK